jgi:uncharacterized protein (TIGR03000 family)
MNRHIPLLITLCLLADGSLSYCQGPIPPTPTHPPFGNMTVKPIIAPPVGFSGGMRNPTSGYLLPAYGGFYLTPSLFPYTNTFYPSYTVLPSGFAGGFGIVPGNIINVTNNVTVAQSGYRPNTDGRGNPNVNPAVSGEDTATLIIALPREGEVWVAGEKQPDIASEFTITSPVLKPGEPYVFDVRAEWIVDRQRMRSTRSIPVYAGERQKWTVILGDQVR